MKRLNIYSIGLVMICSVLYAAQTKPRKHLQEILTTVNDLIDQPLQGEVQSIRGKRLCGKNFFCLAEKSLSPYVKSHKDEKLSRLRNLLHKYNNETHHTSCINHSNGGHISIHELLEDIKNCTNVALRNHTHPPPGRHTPF
ncbi:hypothetical protein WMY93_009778 [Mugilogobius chulae]|uniref:Interleukin-4 n=1 Tax=Mugilogobius chulae TaxID=88201 RepID=A0AAW0PCP2_9GOBI